MQYDDNHDYIMNPASHALTVQQRKQFYSNRPINEISCDRSQSANVPRRDQRENTDNRKESRTEQEMYDSTQTPNMLENSYAVLSDERARMRNLPAENGQDSIFMEDQSFENSVESRETSVDAYLEPVRTPAPESWVIFGDMEANPITPTTPPNSNHAIPNLHPLNRDPSPSSFASGHDLNLSLLTPKVLEASGMATEDPAVLGWNSPPPDSDAPPLYVPQCALERGANQSLKHSQMAELKADIDNPGGVKIQLKRTDCLYAIAFVDCFKAVW